MPEPTLCCRVRGGYCDRCDVLVGLPGLHVIAVEHDARDRLVVTIESAAGPMGCYSCGVIARGHGRVEVGLVDAPAFGRPVRLVWRKRRWLCPEPACDVGSFVEQDERVASARALLTARACWWAIEQIRRENASVNGIRRQLGTGWRTVWDSIRPLLQAADVDASRFEGVTILGVDEHVWHRGWRARPQRVDRDGRSDSGCPRAHQGSATRPGPWPLRRGLQQLADRPRGDVSGRGAGGDVGPVPRVQERHR